MVNSAQERPHVRLTATGGSTLGYFPCADCSVVNSNVLVPVPQAASEVGLSDVSSLMPPEPPPLRSLAAALPESIGAYTCGDGENTVRYDRKIVFLKYGCCEIRSL